MSSNIYEDPDLMRNVIYSKGEDGGARVERLVDIYEGAGALTEHRVDLSAQDERAHGVPPQRNLLSAAVLVLGLLSLLLVAGVTVLSIFYVSVNWEKDLLNRTYQTSLEELHSSYENLSTSYCWPQGRKGRTQGNVTRWKRFRCSCYYKSSEMKSWMDSRRDCQSKGADLLIINSKDEQEFVSELSQHGASWIGLQAVKRDEWQEDVEWRWVDRSKPTYMAWRVGVNVNPEDGSRGYIGQQGTFEHTTNHQTSKHWICEKENA
uniref:CD209 antigen-like protein D n=1 Tax=Scatophagus argus TaxID=75038 RepID=UPI001ED7E876|nr:CD209 antigen-like protein D [Scatophagus argus]